MANALHFIQQKLAERRSAGSYRSLKSESGLVDFCSNDYLGFARSEKLKELIDAEVNSNFPLRNGSAGSRLLAGNSAYTEETEKYIAGLHQFEAGLFFNSGYDANLGLFSSLPQRGDTIIMDKLIHASIIDGSRLSFANRYSFKHNDLNSLEEKLKIAKGNCYVAVESVYSMDGDSPPLAEIADLVEQYDANLIVDEAHAVGLFGFGLIDEELTEKVFAKIVTFGKALGCHGAVVLGRKALREYLINFARSFIYTTAPAPHHTASVKIAYEQLLVSDHEIGKLKSNIILFKESIKNNAQYPLIESNSAIQCIILGSNEKAKTLANILQNQGLDVRPILNPTVAQGSERIRICLHSFNTEKEIILLTQIINTFTDAE